MGLTILIIGGAGFIGSIVNKLLIEKGFNTIILDNLSQGACEALIGGTFILGDLGCREDLDKIFSHYKVDAVMHFAAFTDVGESVIDPAKYYENNVASTLTLLKAVRDWKIKYFIFSSSAAVYGLPQSEIITEEHPCAPINPYGTTKLMVEKILSDWDVAYGLKYTALRYFNAAGGDPDAQIKNYKKKENNLIPLVLRSLLNGSQVTLFGNDWPTKDGTCIRDYIHVWDLATAHLLALERLMNGEPSAIYNLGNGKGYSVKEVIQAAEKITGLSVKVNIGPRRPGDPPFLVASSSKAQKELHWKPEYPDLESMVDHAWKSYQKDKK